jgi:hypothetical protein
MSEWICRVRPGQLNASRLSPGAKAGRIANLRICVRMTCPSAVTEQPDLP